MSHEHHHDHDCNCGHDHHNEEVEVITLTLDDDSELECAVIGIFPFEEKEYIALMKSVTMIWNSFLSKMKTTSIK